MVLQLIRSRSLSPEGWARPNWQKNERTDRGAVAVEFALILPVFLFMLFFMLDAGRYLTVQMAMNNAAQVGARSVALGQDASTMAEQVHGAIPAAIIRLSTLNPTLGSDSASVPVEPALCPILSETQPAIDPTTGEVISSSDGTCVNLVDNPAQSCTTALPNYRAMAKVSVTFKWLTPMGLIVNLVNPSDVGAGSSIFFDRNSTDTTTISGKAKLICQN